jgi:putative endonuclease
VYYVGFTNNIARRLIEHKEGIGCNFSQKYNIKILLYYEVYESVNLAIAREKEIKRWRREKKVDLIRKRNIDFIDLSKEVLNTYGITESDCWEIVRDIKSRRGGRE